MRCSLSDSCLWLYPDSQIDASPVTHLRCDVPLNSVGEVNILFNGLDTTCELTFEAVGLRDGIRGRWARLVDVPVEKNTGPSAFTEVDGGEKNEFVTRRAPFRVYDCMKPERKKLTPGASTLAMRFSVDVTLEAKAGEYKILLEFSQGTERASLEFQLVVHDFDIPAAADEGTLSYTNWISYRNIGVRHGIELWSEAYWTMLRKYADLMCRGRQNTFLIRLGDVFDVEDGMPRLNRKRLERIVATFTDAGLWLIEGGHFGSRTSGWTSPTFSTNVVRELATTSAGNRIIASMASQLMDVIIENGWQDRWIQHVADEPIPCNAADYRIFVGMVRRHMPGVYIMDATQDPSMAGSVDAWCPVVSHYQAQRDAFEEAKRDGDSLWCYTCCVPGGKWLNRLLDNELIRPVLLGWGCARYDMDGFLHWGLNYFRDDQDPFKKSCLENWSGGTNTLPAGDTHVIYPGTDGPWSGVRFEAMRQGIEDREMLTMLREMDEEAAAKIIDHIFRAFDDYTTDIGEYRANRRRLLEAIEEYFDRLEAGENEK